MRVVSRIVSLFVLLSLPAVTAADPPAAAVRVLDESVALDAGIRVEGKPVARTRFKDAKGEHVVVVTETDVVETPPKKDDDGGSSKRLFAYHFEATKSGTYALLWQVKDFVLDCPFDLTLSYVPSSLQISDLDRDGIAETRFGYRLSCRSDVSPDTVKLIMHEGKEKYAIRGDSRVAIGEEKGQLVYEGGKSERDASLARAPKAFAEAAQADWDRWAGR